jgi:hypothetical protein
MRGAAIDGAGVATFGGEGEGVGDDDGGGYGGTETLACAQDDLFRGHAGPVAV